jgi:hypothetical protein
MRPLLPARKHTPRSLAKVDAERHRLAFSTSTTASIAASFAARTRPVLEPVRDVEGMGLLPASRGSRRMASRIAAQPGEPLQPPGIPQRPSFP